MGMMQRRKGRSGEQEVAAILRDHLGLDIKRNWQAQSAEGGADLTGIPGWAAEVKLATRHNNAWWPQTVGQALRAGFAPVLIYRLTDGTRRGQPELEKWRAVVRLRDLSREDVDQRLTAELSLGGWIAVVRERLSDAPQVAPPVG
jgi:hypothetical protein